MHALPTAMVWKNWDTGCSPKMSDEYQITSLHNKYKNTFSVFTVNTSLAHTVCTEDETNGMSQLENCWNVLEETLNIKG